MNCFSEVFLLVEKSQTECFQVFLSQSQFPCTVDRKVSIAYDGEFCSLSEIDNLQIEFSNRFDKWQLKTDCHFPLRRFPPKESLRGLLSFRVRHAQLRDWRFYQRNLCLDDKREEKTRSSFVLIMRRYISCKINSFIMMNSVE